jgi:hypothetical protein
MADGNHGNTEIRNNGYTDFLGPAERAERAEIIYLTQIARMTQIF